MILAASIALLIIACVLFVGSLCRAAHNGDEIIRNEIDREELNAIQKHARRVNIRQILGKILS